jgi:hypothetical protein
LQAEMENGISGTALWSIVLRSRADAVHAMLRHR